MLNTILTWLVNNPQLIAQITLVAAVVGVLYGAFSKDRNALARVIATLIAVAYSFVLFILLMRASEPVYLVCTSFLMLYAGFFLILFAFPLIPGLLRLLANDPQNGNKDSGMFIFLEQGRVIVIQRGKKFLSAKMDYAAHKWRGEDDNSLTPRNPDYWEVIPSGSTSDSHPIPFPIRNFQELVRYWWWILYSPISISWWVWKRYVYGVFGAVFTGVYPFQGPLVHFMVYSKKITNPITNEVSLEPANSWSNHFRVSEFVYHIIVPNSDTKDQAQAKVSVTLVLQVFNAHRTANRTDGDLGGRIASAATAGVTEFTRTVNLSDLQGSGIPGSVRNFANALKEIGDRSNNLAPLWAIGLEITDVQIFDISPSTPGLAESLSRIVNADAQLKADMKLAVGEAEYLKQMLIVAGTNPDAVVLAEIRSRIEMANAIKGNDGAVVILGGGQNTDPVALAQLKATRNLKGGP